MGSKNRYSKQRAKKKREFRGNQFSKAKDVRNLRKAADESETPTTRRQPRPFPLPLDEEPCTSAKKLRLTEGEDNSALRSEDDGNIIVRMDFLRDLVALIGVCPACKSSALTIENELNLKMGFAYKFRVTCSECGWMQQITTSKTTHKSTPGQKPYEINTGMVIGFREMGQGFASMETFCRCLNMPPPMSKPAYNKTVSSLRDIFIEVAMESIKKGAEETKRHVTKEN